jgi:acyl-CoA dehydrogenase
MTSDSEAGGLFQLTTQHRALAREARELAESLADVAAEADASDSTHPEVRRRLAESGLCAATVPGAYGGRFAEVDALAVTVIREQLAAVSGHLDSLFALQGIGSYALAAAGNDELRERWLPATGKLEAVAALGLTEPHVGSDLKALSTTIEQHGDELVLRGHKSFITNGGDADYYCVLGREDGGYSIVLVPAGTTGLSTHRPYQIIAPHVMSDVVLDDVRVPAAYRIGEPGQGFRLVLATLATFRVSVAGAAVGLASAALHEALLHTTTREQFGTTVARLGPVPTMLAQSWTDIEMARSLTYRAAAAAARDPMAALALSSMAKVGATEAAGRVLDRCVQVMGRFGLVRGSTIERLYREVRPMRIYEGSTEVILDQLAKQLVKEHTG